MGFYGRIGCALVLILCCAPGAGARESGWVPAPPKPAISKGQPGKAKRERAARPQPIKPRAATVYDNEPPVTETELNAFVELLPRFRAWARKNGEEAHPVLTTEGKPDFLYSPAAARWISEHSFAPSRFFCVMGRMAAALVIVEEGNDFKGTRPADMPSVSPQELALVRKHLGELLAAGRSVTPAVK